MSQISIILSEEFGIAKSITLREYVVDETAKWHGIINPCCDFFFFVPGK